MDSSSEPMGGPRTSLDHRAGRLRGSWPARDAEYADSTGSEGLLLLELETMSLVLSTDSGSEVLEGSTFARPVLFPLAG